MGIAELKEQLHQRIEALDNVELPDSLNHLLAAPAIFEIPQQYLPGIARGLQDFHNGDTITLDEFEAKYEQLLKD